MTPSIHHPQESIDLKEAIIAFVLAILAALMIKLPALFGVDLDHNEEFYIQNLSFFVLPFLVIYFAWKRNLEFRTLALLAAIFVITLVITTLYPLEKGDDSIVLLAIHLPIILWMAVGVAFTSGQWNRSDNRMNFIRFSGEFFIYYVLIGLGGGVLTGFMGLMFGTIGIDIEPFFESWLLPCGASGAVLIAAWLVEIRNNLSGNFAPVLARLFSPLFAIMLVLFLGTLVWSGGSLILERNILITFDMLLVVVLGLCLYSISARNTDDPPGLFDVVQVLLVISALLADAAALWGISERIADFGFTQNRIAAFGLNMILLVNLAWSAVLYIRFISGTSSYASLEKWQTGYLDVYVGWAVIVVILFPPLFGFT